MVKIGKVDGKVLASLGLFGIISLNQINSETILVILSSLSLFQLLVLKLRGCVLVDYLHLTGWKMSLPFYLIRCSKHGYQMTYPSGHDNNLICPKCVNPN